MTYLTWRIKTAKEHRQQVCVAALAVLNAVLAELI